MVIMTIWLLGYTKRNPLLTYYGSSGWHAHEMLFGYMVAVLAGYLSVIIRTESGGLKLHGVTMFGLVLLWVAGRVLPVLPSVPPWSVAVVDVSFLPVFTIVLLIPPGTGGWKNKLPMILLLLILAAANVLVHFEWLGYVMDSARLGIVVAIYSFILLLSLIAGRLIPLYNKPNPEKEKIAPRPVIDHACAISIIVLALADLGSPNVELVVMCALLAAAVHMWRWLNWLVRVDWSQTLLWVLMTGYAWLIVGFVLMAVSYSGHISHMIAFHAFMVGGFGELTLGMMVWVALTYSDGSSGLSSLIAMAMVMLNIAAVVRIVGPLSSFRYSQALITAAGALWIISFVLFLLSYAHLFARVRLDKRQD